MNDRTPDAATSEGSGFLGPDPGPSIRRWVAMLLRLGIGLGLLNSGLIGYIGTGGAGGPGIMALSGTLSPFFTALPYLQIALGMALILGFLLTPAAIGAGFFTLYAPVVLIVEIATNGSASAGASVGRGFNNPNGLALILGLGGSISNLPGLLTHAALIWLSPVANHPYSVDALIFRRVERDPFSVSTPPRAPEETPVGPTTPEA